MSLSRSPSPRPNGGWTTRGLTDNTDFNNTSGDDFTYDLMSTRQYEASANGFAADSDNDAQWAAARAKSQQIRKQNGQGPGGGGGTFHHPTIQTKNEGFFKRTRRQVSQVLPTFNKVQPDQTRSGGRNWRDQEKLGRGRWYLRGNGSGRLSWVRTYLGNVLRKFKAVFTVLGVVALVTTIMSQANIRTKYRSSAHLGGGSNFVIILAANEGGGVMDWKGPREWAIERDSVKNKKNYAARWGYHLEIADMSTKKRYAHEWRESWEKVDVIRNCMAKYPQAEWFWWLDLTTFIMEPSISLQSHIFNHLEQSTYRDINIYNPLNITHPPTSAFLDPVSLSPTGDNLTSSIDLIVPQDCSGFNLGSFFVRRSAWTDRLLDIWWDPVLYEQKHMDWEHKEQDALEHLYTSQPYIRTHVAFIDQRKINSFPSAACPVERKEDNHDDTDGNKNKDEENDDLLDPRFHYSEKDRDFMVNMAGCEWGRDCWAEMYGYRELSKKLNRSTTQKAKDVVKEWFQKNFRGRTESEDDYKATSDQINKKKGDERMRG